MMLESFLAEDIFIHLGSDQTSLHNPWSAVITQLISAMKSQIV